MKKNKLPVLFITVLLFFIPFFWFRPGVADLGGDSSRLYFYDPIAYLHSQPLYGITSSGVGGESISYFGIPFVLLIAIVKSIVVSTTLVVNIFHGVTLSFGFLFCYLIVKDLLLSLSSDRKKYNDLTAIIAGLFYVFSPSLILGWDKAILTHSQFFLNPLLFFLLLRFLTRNNFKYLALALLVSFLFAPNFSFIAAPPFFAFYPLAIAFLLLYVVLILKKPLPFKKILLGLGLFILIHLFHLGPHVVSLFSGGSEINNAVFSGEAKYSRGLSYFSAIAPEIKVSYSLMTLPQMTERGLFSFMFIFFPLVILVGFIWNRTRLYLLTAIFFLITLFFVSANVTDVGLSIYKSLFDIPGFSMFRNFFGQWIFIFTFFYALFLGQALYFLFHAIHKKYIVITSGFILLILIGNAVPFITGELVNKVHYQSKGIKVPSEIDPEYEKVLTFIRELPIDGKFISFPLSGPGYQTLMGINGGAYQGPSTITYLTGKNDFTGYDGLMPFNEIFLELVRNNDIKGINRLFSILNIKYIFYNSDPRIYDTTFPKYPYDYARVSMPKTQAAYKEFITKLPVKKVKSFGRHYHIYEVENFLPHMYIADNQIYATDALTPYFSLDTDASFRSVVYTENVVPANDASVILEAVNNNPLNELLNNYHLHVHSPFISRRQDDLLYPIVIRREKQTVAEKSSVPNDYLDYSLLHLSKRILELEQYKDTPLTHAEFNEPELWEIFRWKEYYSWESNLSRYQSDMKDLILWVKTSSLSESTKNAMYIKINQNLTHHENELTRYINESNHDNKNKNYLLKRKKDMFGSLYSNLDIKPLDITKVPYTIDIPGDLATYNVYIRSQKDEMLDPSNYSLQVNEKTLLPLDKEKSSVIQLDSVNIAKDSVHPVLNYKPYNLVETSTWIGTGTDEKIQNITTLTINNQFGNGIYSKKINNYKLSKQYIITFDYYTEGVDLAFRLFEKNRENNKDSTSTYFNKNLSSKTWSTYQAVLTASPNAQSGYLQFLVNSKEELGKVHLRNMSVIEVPNERIFFKKSVGSEVKTDVPTISFTKHNPTFYTINVKNASEPYALVFSESFNPKWQLSYSDLQSYNQPRNIEHFNGQIKEGSHTNDFFKNLQLLTLTSTPIPPGKHQSGNGYANVWNIQPSDTNNKKNYTLYLQYVPQKYIYIYLTISSFTVLALLGYILFYRPRRK